MALEFVCHYFDKHKLMYLFLSNKWKWFKISEPSSTPSFFLNKFWIVRILSLFKYIVLFADILQLSNLFSFMVIHKNHEVSDSL